MMARVFGCHLGRDLRHVHVVGRRIDVDEHRSRSQAGNRASRGKERVRRRDHLIAGTDVLGHQAGQQSIATRRNADRVRAAASRRAMAFSHCSTFGPRMKCWDSMTSAIAASTSALMAGVLRLKIEQRNLHTWSSSFSCL